MSLRPRLQPRVAPADPRQQSLATRFSADVGKSRLVGTPFETLSEWKNTPLLFASWKPAIADTTLIESKRASAVTAADVAFTIYQ